MRQGFLENGETKERRRLPKKEVRVSREKEEEGWGESFVIVKASILHFHNRNSM